VAKRPWEISLKKWLDFPNRIQGRPLPVRFIPCRKKEAKMKKVEALFEPLLSVQIATFFDPTLW
jgi:hypothetical protein